MLAKKYSTKLIQCPTPWIITLYPGVEPIHIKTNMTTYA